MIVRRTYLFLRIVLASTFFFLLQFPAWSDDSYETDRGYREPAVVGTAIVEDPQTLPQVLIENTNTELTNNTIQTNDSSTSTLSNE